jgi:hypothetical protein
VSDPSSARVSAALVEVHLVGLPVALWARTQEHTDELIREFTLLASQLRESGAHHEVPVRLVRLLEELTAQYSGLTTEQETRLATAALNGVAVIDDLVFRVPAQAAEAGAHLGALLDEADEYCRAGQHLLTLATPPALVRFRDWYLDAFTEQVAGRAPTAWADYRA